MLVMKLFKVNIVLTIQGNGFDLGKKVSLKLAFFVCRKGENMIVVVFKRSRSPS